MRLIQHTMPVSYTHLRVHHNCQVSTSRVLHSSRDIKSADCQAVLLVLYRTGSNGNEMCIRDRIITYDFSITYKDGIKKAKKEEFVNWTKKQDHMTDLMEVSESAVTIRANGEKQDATMILPMSKDDFNGYITLQDRKSKTKYKLDDEGIILTEKAASLLGVSKGDTLSLIHILICISAQRRYLPLRHRKNHGN